MKALFLCLLLSASLLAETYESLSRQIIRDLNYIFQEKLYTGGATFASPRTFKYEFKSISKYEIEINRRLDGKCEEEPFLIDLREEYFVELQPDTKCDPALVISHELDIVYLYVKDRCGHFGGYNLYKRATSASVLLKEHFYKAQRLEGK